VLQNQGRAHGGGVQDDRSSCLRDLALGRMDIGMGQGQTEWRTVMMIRLRRLLTKNWKKQAHGRQESAGQPSFRCDLPNPAGFHEASFGPANRIRFVHRALHFIAVGCGFQSETFAAAFRSWLARWVRRVFAGFLRLPDLFFRYGAGKFHSRHARYAPDENLARFLLRKGAYCRLTG